MIKCNLERHICVKLVYVYDPNVVQESLLGSRAVLGCRGESLSLLLPPSPALKLLYLSPLSLPPSPPYYPSLTLYTPSLPLPFPAFLYTKMLFFIRARNAESGKWSQSRKKRRGVEGEGARSEIRDSASFFRNRFTFN